MPSRPAPTRAYFDHAATTPVLPEVMDVLVEQLRRLGNPSSLHASGREARRVVEESRESIAVSLGSRPGDVVFTSGGTEADNLAVKGIAAARRAGDPARTRVLASAVEHHAVLDSLEWLAEQDFDVRLLDVDSVGRVRTEQLRGLLAEDPGSLTVSAACGSTTRSGHCSHSQRWSRWLRPPGVPVHSDAVQACEHSAGGLRRQRARSMTVTAHKLGGPVGVAHC
jgi:cysteine desulfurase